MVRSFCKSLSRQARGYEIRFTADTATHSLPALDAHGHLDPDRPSSEPANIGAVLAMTLSLDEAARVVERWEPTITWGVGCHPRRLEAQESFDLGRFRELVQRSAIVGEVGLDTGSRVPPERVMVESDHGYRDPPAAIPCRRATLICAVLNV